MEKRKHDFELGSSSDECEEVPAEIVTVDQTIIDMPMFRSKSALCETPRMEVPERRSSIYDRHQFKPNAETLDLRQSLVELAQSNESKHELL